MSQQVLDMRRSIQILRRHKVLLGVMVALGIVAGCAYSTLNPSRLTSSALVVFPETQNTPAPGTTANAADTGSDGYTVTQEVIAGSTQVLSAALPHARPAMSLAQLRSDIQIESLTPYILSINAKGKVAADAEVPSMPSPEATSPTSTAPAAPSGRSRRACSSRPRAPRARGPWKS